MDTPLNILHTWKGIYLQEEQTTLPNGKTITHTTISHPGAAVILPIANNGDIVLINQYRPSLKKWLLELPAGTLESNEPIELCAVRELAEETGYSAETMISLGQVTPLAGFCDEIQYLFVAKGLTEVSKFACDDDEVIEVVSLSLHDIEQKIVEGEITDAKTIACLSKAKLCGYI
ncbi:NUDIX hydrolase [Vibrio neptunius]|uniref:NUDIX hydrolase n=1 Tax=Vibrio neptunius TaxID=170651 RepID=UPI0019D0F95A|nr:NUDIX hydrolase [Vibrio neptunius]MBN3574387.1 NUDIX hydrolase [Vibrio neptunius]QXX08875.1 NUDIX hydrolase [Vibrio neptunius]